MTFALHDRVKFRVHLRLPEVPQLSMRVRILGQYIPSSLAVLALIEALLCFLALYAAVCIRFQVGVSGLAGLVRTRQTLPDAAIL